MKMKYGELSSKQLNAYRKKLHSKVFWLLLYVDPKTRDQYPNVDVNKYFDSLMQQINGFNCLLNYPGAVGELLSLLEAARIEFNKDDFNYRIYHKYVLDAHAMIDKLQFGVG